MTAEQRLPGVKRVRKTLKSGEVAEYHYRLNPFCAFWNSQMGIEANSADYVALFMLTPEPEPQSPEARVPKTVRARLAVLLWKAKARRDCSLTPRDLTTLYHQQMGRCAISGMVFREARSGETRSPYGVSIDRIDSAIGYHPGNVRLVLSMVNYAMNAWGAAPLVEISRAIARRNPKRRRVETS